MLTSYLRSSSYNNWDVCQQQYFINYVLGQPRAANMKADKGTIAHKVLEILAECKKQLDATNATYVSFEDDNIGNITCSREDFLAEYMMTKSEVDVVNKRFRDKKVYVDPEYLDYGHIRHGYDLVENLVQRVFNYYSLANPQHNWTSADYQDCDNFVWIPLDAHKGQFDPRRRRIAFTEQSFDFAIDAEWATFKSNGRDGQARIKGTIDLITQVDDTTYEIIDWKTGQRKDFATGEVKDYDKLCKDPQLMLYYYAARQLFPLIDNIMMTIFFVRDGGPFSICFEEHHMQTMEDLLRKRFKEIWDCSAPQMISPDQSSFKCRLLCDYYKNNWKNTNTNVCKFIHQQIKEIGIDEVTKRFTYEGHSADNYNAPGGV